MSKTEAHQQLEIEPGKSRPLFSLRLFVRNCWLVKILIDRDGFSGAEKGEMREHYTKRSVLQGEN